jgi:anti-sigma factor RsiW
MNTINRYNYENYFLLWIDGELPHNQMEEMDQFIANNPDLADELALLQETKLPLDETIFFPHKAGLLKYAAGEISLDNCESYFLLYVDNELSATQQAEVELFVLQHPTLQESFLLLQQIKLTPELVVFNNKEVLYLSLIHI